jgi:hypothetical protein
MRGCPSNFKEFLPRYRLLVQRMESQQEDARCRQQAERASRRLSVCVGKK